MKGSILVGRPQSESKWKVKCHFLENLNSKFTTEHGPSPPETLLLFLGEGDSISTVATERHLRDFWCCCCCHCNLVIDNRQMGRMSGTPGVGLDGSTQNTGAQYLVTVSDHGKFKK